MKLSNVTNPHDRDLVQAVSDNLQTLETLLTAPLLAAPEARLKKLEAFFAAMNTRNNIRNTVAYGDGENPGDSALTARLEAIDRSLRHKVARLGKVAPFWHDVLKFWDERKALIPEKIDLLANPAQPSLRPLWIAAAQPEQGRLSKIFEALTDWFFSNPDQPLTPTADNNGPA